MRGAYPGIVRFVQVGLGYRSQAFRRVLNDLGGFECVGVVLRRVRTASVAVYTDLGQCLEEVRPDLVIGITGPSATPGIIETAVDKGIPVLVETPPAATERDLDRLHGYCDCDLVQVAEQYPYMPGQAARLQAVRRGLIGEISQVQVSSTQTYHAMALIRAYLGIGPTDALVRAHRFSGPLVDPLTRAGWTSDPNPRRADMVLASVDFGSDKSGIYDFTDNQTRNLLRTRRLLVRGSHGEISGDQMVRLADHNLITTTYLNRRQTGHDLDLNGYCTYQITLGDQVLWTNPWPQTRWNDDEVAVAEVLTRMAAHIEGTGPGPYPLSEAIYDARLGLAIDTAIGQDRAVEVRG